jgi:hypothetical protein
MTTLVYLIGRPGTGKYTIATELAKSGYIICDNHLINNPVFSLLNYDGFSDIPPYAWNTIGRIREIIFDFLIRERHNSYVLTNVLNDDEGDRNLYHQVKNVATARNSVFVPVKLLISQEENIKRIQNIDRQNCYKSRDVKDTDPEQKLLQFSHPNLLEVDVTTLTACEAANIILEYVSIL